MKAVTICSSVKFENEIRHAYQDLKKAGYKILSPEKDDCFVISPNNEEKILLAKQHFAAMEKSDFIYFICENGYLGTSCKLELGYAIALKKPIFFSQTTGDIVLDSWAKDFVSMSEIQDYQFQ